MSAGHRVSFFTIQDGNAYLPWRATVPLLPSLLLVVLLTWALCANSKTGVSKLPVRNRLVAHTDKFHLSRTSLPAKDEIKPLADITYTDIKPLQLRPYKAKYFLTLGIEHLDVSELLLIDEDHVRRSSLRREILANPQHEAVFSTSQAQGAVSELYQWLTQTYLPTRFPTLFRIDEARSTLKNLVTDDEFPLESGNDTASLLHRLGRMIDEDLMFLLPSSDGDGYFLGAYTVAFFSGFDISSMKGVKLRDMHREVPSYKPKLQMPMERFFRRLEVGRYVKRANWTIIMDDTLCIGHGASHVHVDEQHEPQVGADLSRARLRCERQVFHRLPVSNAIVFSFKTYLYSLEAVKADGSGEALAEAIQGLENTPGIPGYKGSLKWGEAVRAFLLSSAENCSVAAKDRAQHM